MKRVVRKRVAIVVPRCHQGLVGGAEALGWQYATLLASDYDVDVLTSTASDYVSWKNDLPAGSEHRDGVTIRRFPVLRERGLYFHDLHRRLLTDFESTAGVESRARVRWPEALQDEFIRAQGPCCPDLIAHLEQQGDAYAAVVFLTYLYPTTYDGVRALAHRRYAIVPTLHDEPAGYFNVLAGMGRRAPRLLWNTRAEQRLGRALWNVDEGVIVSMAVATTPVAPAKESAPYLLYCGRIDAHKGCAMLIDAFLAWKRARPSNLQLVLTGADKLGLGHNHDIRYLGFVDDARKFSLMAGALAFVHPSAYESLSIVVLEAMAQGTPIIVNGDCAALVEHVEGSGSGRVFHDAAQLHAAIDDVVASDANQRASLGEQARDYVIANYSLASIRERLVAEIEALAAT